MNAIPLKELCRRLRIVPKRTANGLRVYSLPQIHRICWALSRQQRRGLRMIRRPR